MAGSSAFFVVAMVFAEQFERSNERRDEQPQHGIDTPDVTKLVRIGQMTAVPRQKKTALVIRRQRQMKRISKRIVRHYAMLDVGLDNFTDSRRNRKTLDIRNQCQSILLDRMGAALQFVDDCFTGPWLERRLIVVPPRPGLVSTGDHVRFSPNLMVEAGNGRFKINKRLGHSCFDDW
jgi:hypothetical protein